MTTVSDYQKQLDGQDKQDQSIIANIYDGSYSDLKNYIQYFIDNYSDDDGVLGLGEMQARVSTSDKKQWSKCLSKYSNVLKSTKKGKYLLDLCKKTAGLDKMNLLSSIIGIAVGYATTIAGNYISDQLSREYEQSARFHSSMATKASPKSGQVDLKEIDGEAIKIVNAKTYGLTTSDRLWARNEYMVSEVRNAVTRAITTGVDDHYLKSHLYKFIKGSAGSMNTSFDKTERFIANRLLLNEKGRVEFQAALNVYNRSGVNMVKWVCQAGACTKLCVPIENKSPYKINEVPDRPHISCRCIIVPYDAAKIKDN